MRLVGLGLALLFVSLSSTAKDIQLIDANAKSLANDPWIMLEKTAKAARLLNYEGQFVYQNGNQTRTVQITHMNSGGHEMARNIVLQQDKPREVFSEGSDIVIFQPTNNKVLIEKRRGQNLFPAMLPTDMSAIKSSYKATIGPTDVVAERTAQIIDLTSKDIYRYSYRIWMDQESGLLLKMTVNNPKGELLEQLYFDQINMMNTQDFKGLTPSIDLSKHYEIKDATASSQLSDDWVLTDMPSGYREIDHIQRAVMGRQHQVEQLIFSDGIASVSLFIEPLTKGTRPKVGHVLMGSTNICANIAAGYQIIVVGEVPLVTVEKIAKSINFKKQTISNK